MTVRRAPITGVEKGLHGAYSEDGAADLTLVEVRRAGPTKRERPVFRRRGHGDHKGCAAEDDLAAASTGRLGAVDAAERQDRQRGVAVVGEPTLGVVEDRPHLATNREQEVGPAQVASANVNLRRRGARRVHPDGRRRSGRPGVAETGGRVFQHAQGHIRGGVVIVPVDLRVRGVQALHVEGEQGGVDSVLPAAESRLNVSRRRRRPPLRGGFGGARPLSADHVERAVVVAHRQQVANGVLRVRAHDPRVPRHRRSTRTPETHVAGRIGAREGERDAAQVVGVGRP